MDSRLRGNDERYYLTHTVIPAQARIHKLRINKGAN